MTATADSAVISTLIALEYERCRAISSSDLDALGQLLDEDLMHVHATGRAQNKVTYLASLAGNPRTTTRRDISVRVFGDIAVMTGVLINSFGDGSETRSSELYATQIWIQRDGRWRQLNFAASGPVSRPEGEK
jgi:ketosteroid isomerase-like protein